MFVALEGLFPKDTPMECKVLVSILILMGVWLLCFIGVSVYVLFKLKRKLMDGRNGKSVYVMYGDLFSKKIVKKTDTRRNICFDVNRCFDTIENDHLIASSTLHGIALNKLYNEGVYTSATLYGYPAGDIPGC